MMKRYILFLVLLTVISCKKEKKEIDSVTNKESVITDELVIAFGSCNNQFSKNELWDDVLANTPSVWIWGGDIIYSDTDDPDKMKSDYQALLDQKEYQQLKERVKILGTWDDHDYGLNDGGREYIMKDKSQQLFLDFLDVDKNDKRRERKGVYHSEIIETEGGIVKIIILDTRYFRSALTPSETKGKRYQPNTYGEGTILGDEQWQWLEQELQSSAADFNIIVSSIQILSNEHGFETWGNFPHEVDKLKEILKKTEAKNVLLLSGDRHISEFSKQNVPGLSYELVDFTSSGLTHSYSNFSGESNPFRVGNVVFDKSFGLLRIDFKTNIITMEMRGDNNKIQQKMRQVY